jgi:hypothetical protein
VKIDPEPLKAFLAELSELSRKHKIEIGGCGCCGSPFLFPLTDKELDGRYTLSHAEDYLRWER